jgi:hypothetical protein
MKSKRLKEIKYRADPETGCWICTSHKGSGKKLYPKIGIGKKVHSIHRLMFSWFTKESMENKLVCHSCDNPKCINPEHLWLGTNKENLADMVIKNRQAKGSKIGAAKLTEDQVKYIKNSGLSGYELAEVFNVAASTINSAKRGKTWRHVNV